MLTETLQKIFTRDLNKLKSELESYQSEENIWKTTEGISNSAGNLSLHLIGNLNWFVGAQLGNSRFIRKRELEFSSTDIPRTQLLTEFDNTIEVVKNTLVDLSDEQLEMDFPLDVFKEKMTTYYFLVHLSTHLSYHLGQINYHRRLLDKVA